MQEKSYLKVVNYVWNKVLGGELEIGDKLLPEREFATSLGLSRSSVREGIKVLEILGVISSQQGSGNFITGNFEEVIEKALGFMYMLNGMKDSQITEFRHGLEWKAVNIVTGKLSKEKKDEFLFYLKKLEDSTNEQEAVIYDKKIHYLLIESTENEYIKTSYHALTKIMDIYIPRLRGNIITGMNSKVELRNAHRLIIEGIVEGNLEKGMLGIEKHFSYIQAYQEK